MPPARSVAYSVMHIGVSALAGIIVFILVGLAGVESRVALFTVALSVTALVGAYFEAGRTRQAFSRLAPHALIGGLLAGVAAGLIASALQPYVQR